MKVDSIVVATDNSDHAAKAVEIAVTLARQYDAQLTILHVVGSEVSDELRRMAEVEHLVEIRKQSQPALDNIPAGLGAALREAILHENITKIATAIGEQALREAASIARRHGLDKPRLSLEHGEAAATILDFARSEKADMLVLGSRGLGNWKGAVMGSISSKVTHAAPCTCVTVT